MADSDPGSDHTRARGQRDSGRYFMLPSETAERFRREDNEPDTTKPTSEQNADEEQ